MQYHASLTLPDGGYLYWDYSKDYLLTNIVSPFLLGQKIIVDFSGPGEKRKALLNLENVIYLHVYKTENKLSAEERTQFRDTQEIGVQCTEEILSEIKYDFAASNVKSLMERLILPPKKQVFIIMKFDDPALDSAYHGVYRPVAESFGYQVLRIDDVQDSGNVNEQILEAIAESEVVISDLTGARPNCYFETGVALATGRTLILTINKEKPHFDLQSNRFITWVTEHELRIKLTERFESITKGGSE